MVRLLLVFALFAGAFQFTTAHAQGRRGQGLRRIFSMKSEHAKNFRSGQSAHRQVRGTASQRSNQPPSFFGFNSGSYPGYGYSSFGYLDPYRFDGYGYDPYRYGSFRAPDLLDDPYFQERYRNNSRYPGPDGRRSRHGR